jgi:hypothetical protein
MAKVLGEIVMGRGTSYKDIQDAIAAGERLTRAQARSLLGYCQAYHSDSIEFVQSIARLERSLRDEQMSHEQDVALWTSLIKRWNSMIDMLHTFLGKRLYDEDGDVAEQYRQALEEKCKSR